MIDYWTKLKLNECWSDRERYNILLDYINSRLENMNEDNPTIEPINEDDDIPETANIIVSVKNTDDEIVSDANVSVYNDDESYNDITDDDGECTINEVIYGEYTIEVVAEGYESIKDTIIVDKDELSVELILNLEM